MFKKIILITIFCIVMMNVVNANLLIQPNPLDITCKVGTTCTKQITLINNFGFDILDFTFGNLPSYGFTFQPVQITKNTTKLINFTLFPTQSYHENIQTNVEFKFFVDLPEDITTHYITISETGFDKTYVVIRKGDSVSWENVDEIGHDIYSPHFGEISILQNSSSSFIFNQIGTYDYYDEAFYIFNSFNGIIEVINRTSQEKAHNPNYDINWVVNLDSVLNPTNLSVANSKASYEIEYNKFKKGLITIRNNGSEIAEIVKLSSNTEWISFEENNFNIDPGEEEWVEYTIMPLLFNTNDTDKTHNFEIKVKASNSDEKVFSISVFIPYHEVSGEIESDIDVAKWFDQFYCPLYPCSKFCNPELPKCFVNGTYPSNGGSTITANISSVDLYNIIRDIGKLKDSGIRTDNQLKIMADKWGFTIPEILNFLNQSISLQQENEEKVKDRGNAIWILGLGTVIIGLTFWVITTINKKSYKKYLTEGAFHYKK